MAFFYLTTSCGFRCPYCPTGPFMMEGQVATGAVLPGAEVLRLLGILRRHVDMLVLTGGEPLGHPDFEMILAGLAGLRFRTVILATNGFLVDRWLDALVTKTDELVVSLDTLDNERGDRLAGCARGTAARVRENIERLARHPGRRCDIAISGVVTPDNIEDLAQVYRYTQRLGLNFAAAPQLIGVHAHPKLLESQPYRRFYDFLIAEKRRGGRVYGSPRYLQHLRDLASFRCYPFTYLVVSPLGDVFYPCLEGGRVVGNLRDEPDLHVLRKRGYAQHGPEPKCCNQCHSACMVGISLILQHPVEALAEGWRLHRQASRRPEAQGLAQA